MTDNFTQAQLEELLPCPFCGSPNVAVGVQKYAVFRACCGGCGACSGARKEKEGAVSDWNRRESLARPSAEELALREAAVAYDKPGGRTRGAIELHDAATAYARSVEERGSCQCPACATIQHASSCAVHNAPALPNGPCDCGAEGRS